MSKHLEVWFQLHLGKKKFDTNFKPNKLGNHRTEPEIWRDAEEG